jgi:hypothetical protein
MDDPTGRLTAGKSCSEAAATLCRTTPDLCRARNIAKVRASLSGRHIDCSADG